MNSRTKIIEGYMYFITLTVVEWIDVFTRPAHKHVILDSLRYCQNNKGLLIHAWCMMSNHLHFLASTKEGYHLSNVLRDFKKFSNKEIIKSIKDFPESRRNWMLSRFKLASENNSKIQEYKFWQDGNAPKEIHTTKFLEQKLNYIHMNPVKAEIVINSEDYLYSSAMDYAGMKGLLDLEMIR